MAPKFAYPVLLGGPFLKSNKVLINHKFDHVTAKDDGYQLLLVPLDVVATVVVEELVGGGRDSPPVDGRGGMTVVLEELRNRTKGRKDCMYEQLTTETSLKHFARMLDNKIYILAVLDDLSKHEREVWEEFKDWFPMDIPHVTRLPDDVYHRFRLKDPEKVIKCRSYACPKKYKDAWRQLLDQHLAAGRIRELLSGFCSPSFLIPKADPMVLPRWVNDYHTLNKNMIPDHYPLPQIETILSNCAKGSIWVKIDMTNSFFQMRVHPDDVKFMVVMTPFRLYEWVVMPMGYRNAPAMHQRRMNMALRKHIGRICHIYLDDIVIWSNSIEEHQWNVWMILQALQDADLYYLVKKSQLFMTELDFLGHHISEWGVEPDGKKVEKIQSWPVPRSAKDIQKFLGLVQYLAAFLPRLAEHCSMLTPLMTKEAQKEWRGWTDQHQTVFQNIKDIILSAECLTTIDHENMGNQRIFVTCDASDRRTGACLSFGETWETARPVAWDSVQLLPVEKNYPTHEKEMLTIVWALKKFHADLLGTQFMIYTDHRTLECFQGQGDLSRRQAQWQEFLSEYDFEIVYMKGGDNMVADVLLHMPDDGGERVKVVAAVLTVSADPKISADIRVRYKSDSFCQKVLSNLDSFPAVKVVDGLIYISSRLVIP